MTYLIIVVVLLAGLGLGYYQAQSRASKKRQASFKFLKDVLKGEKPSSEGASRSF